MVSRYAEGSSDFTSKKLKKSSRFVFTGDGKLDNTLSGVQGADTSSCSEHISLILEHHWLYWQGQFPAQVWTSPPQAPKLRPNEFGVKVAAWFE